MCACAVGLCVHIQYLVSVYSQFTSNLIDGVCSGGSGPLVEATGSTRVLINL